MTDDRPPKGATSPACLDVWIRVDPDEVFIRRDGTTFTGADLIRSAAPAPKCADNDHIPVTVPTLRHPICGTCGTKLPKE